MPVDDAFFLTRVEPVLRESCHACHSHSADRIRGGLVLDSRSGLLQGGSSGPAIVPGDPAKSLLIQAVRHDDPDLQMPPADHGPKLPDTVIADLTAWIAQGAPMKVFQPNPAFASRDVLAALAHSRRPNAALVFLDYMMSRRGQAVWNGSGETASVIQGIPGSLDARTMQPWDVFRYTAEFQRDYKAKFDRMFKA